jgi:S-(hydroxymethyl)glutathione dehydrogenase / alcohol dehydrogenase
MRAAVLTADPAAAGQLEVVDDLDVAKPRFGEVRVQVTQCGICHSDLTVIDSSGGGAGPEAVLGHEAGGIVESVGEGVTTVKPGDKVILSPMAICGRCYACTHGRPTLCEVAQHFMSGRFPDGTTPFSRKGETVLRGLGVGGWSELTVLHETAVCKIPDDIPIEIACLLGCAVQTGVGAVFNTAQVEPGATVLVMGLGGIGQSVVQGARIAGASTIVVSDPLVSRREIAMGLGATHAVDPTTDDVVAAAKEATGGIGVDYAFDAAGSAALIAAGVAATVPGGTTVMVGAPPISDTLGSLLPVLLLTQEKVLKGSLLGTCNLPRDIPRLLALWQRGALDLEGMVTSRRPLTEINDGLDDVRAGRGIRTVIDVS